jgi:D-alanyl-D-alanine carboxypeptidase (penicillin-binding protein 5/6)
VLKEGDVFAPVAAGDGKIVMQASRVALEAVEQGGFFRRAWDSICLFFKNLFG